MLNCLLSDNLLYAFIMEKQKEALLRIVDQLKSKTEEASAFYVDLQSDLCTVSEAYESSLEDLNSEFQKLYDALNQKKELMQNEVKSNLLRKQDSIKDQLKLYDEASLDASELIELSEKALAMGNVAEFNKSALSIKQRITMSSIFRLSMSSPVTDPSCHLVADFSHEENVLQKLSFLPVPATPIMEEDLIECKDNSVFCSWSLPVVNGDAETSDDEREPHFSIESYLFQYRQVKSDQGNQDVPWRTVENIKEANYTVKDLNFSQPFLQVRVQAWNKTLGGNFSSVVAVTTPAFNFKLDREACHGSLKITGDYCVEWGPAAMKGADARVKSANTTRPTSPPVKVASPKKAKTKERFIGESYTVLGDTPVSNGDDVYFEVTSQEGSKTFSIGMTSCALSRYDQLGRTPHSWCLTVNNWIQSTFVAKHNNKMKNLSMDLLPARFGVFYSPNQNYLAFFDAISRECIHSFRQVKHSSPLLPGFSVWCGSLEIHTGIQVPSWVDRKPSPSPKTRSASIISSEPSQDFNQT